MKNDRRKNVAVALPCDKKAIKKLKMKNVSPTKALVGDGNVAAERQGFSLA